MEDEEIKQATFKLSNGIELEIVHNIPTTDELNAAFDNWIVRHQNDLKNKEMAEDSFCSYINSKHIHSACPLAEIQAHKDELLQAGHETNSNLEQT